MARVVQGVPTSWDPNIAVIRFPGRIWAAAWSPCSRFIAISHGDLPGVVILDAATLQQLYTTLPQGSGRFTDITFSPDSCLLTGYSPFEKYIISWDLQTGGLLSNINISELGGFNSLSYSVCGAMIGVVFDYKTIAIYSVFSGTCIFSHRVSQFIKTSWTHGGYLQYATLELKSIDMWKVGFTPSSVPTKTGSLSYPNKWVIEQLVLLPTLHLLAFTSDEKFIVWDAQNKKVLLRSTGVKGPDAISFSPDGCFFLCGTRGREVHIWRKSPAGYIPHQKFISHSRGTIPLISPNGESVVSSSDATLQLWHTENPSTPLPYVSMRAPLESGVFLIEFSPDESLVAVTRRLSQRVTVLDMKSGDLWLAIETNAKTCGLRITEDKVIVVCGGKIVTWNLPARDCVSNVRKKIDDSVQSTPFKHSSHMEALCASISPNLNYLAVVDMGRPGGNISIYKMHTGEKLAVADVHGEKPGFTPSSHEVWCASIDGRVNQWEILEENGSETVKLKQIIRDIKPLYNFPWHSPHGYQVTKDGWVLSSSGKQLLWLPQHWRQDTFTQKKWGDKFLAIWNFDSPEPYILGFDV